MTPCACGCGELCPWGAFKRGHHWRVKVPKSYIERTDPRRGVSAHVHRMRAEAALGRPLPAGCEVHHPDEDKTNLTARLVICQDIAYHKLLHHRKRVLAAGGNPNTEKICGRCHVVKPLTAFSPTRRGRGGRYAYCRVCAAAKHLARYHQRKASAA